MKENTPEISVVIPLYNEEESIPELYEWIVRVMKENNFSYEIIFVDDGSNDNSWEIIKNIAVKDSNVKGISFRRNYGKSAALNTGFRAAKGKVVITMDADLQDSPDEIPALYKMITKDGYDLVSGWKKERHDPITKTVPSKFFNFVTRMVTGINLHDFNCGLKAYKNDVVKSIEIYGEMHRYIPYIAKEAGFKKIGEKVVKHYPRKYGTTKFGLERFINGFLDLLSLTFILKFGKRPMHFFGSIGMLFFIIGSGITIWLIFEKLYKLSNGMKVREIVDQPLFYLALVTVIVGMQMFLAGFLGELIGRSSADRNKYLIKEGVGDLEQE